MKTIFIISVLLAIPFFIPTIFAHTVDSVGEYRLEIGWMNEPVVSGETNGIELYVSPLDQTLPLEEQEFKNGIKGLEKALKIQLVYDGQKVILPLSEDHNKPGKYYAFVDPTLGGYYQANILGQIKDTTISLSMHPPRVENKTYLEFPPRDESIKADHILMQSEIKELKEEIRSVESIDQVFDLLYIAIGLGIGGIVIGTISMYKRK